MHITAIHFHLFIIACSVSLFAMRYGLLMANSTLRHRAFFNRVPRVVDATMLLSGFYLIYVTGIIPFTSSAPWFTEKIACILAYIVLGVFALNEKKSKKLNTLAFLGAIGWLILAINMTETKISVFFG